LFQETSVTVHPASSNMICGPQVSRLHAL